MKPPRFSVGSPIYEIKKSYQMFLSLIHSTKTPDYQTRGILGCGSGKFMELLMRTLPRVQRLVGIDISRKALRSGVTRMKQTLENNQLRKSSEDNGLRRPMDHESKIDLCFGSIFTEGTVDRDEWSFLYDLDAVTMVEVIEHLDQEPLQCVF